MQIRVTDLDPCRPMDSVLHPKLHLSHENGRVCACLPERSLNPPMRDRPTRHTPSSAATPVGRDSPLADDAAPRLDAALISRPPWPRLTTTFTRPNGARTTRPSATSDRRTPASVCVLNATSGRTALHAGSNPRGAGFPQRGADGFRHTRTLPREHATRTPCGVFRPGLRRPRESLSAGPRRLDADRDARLEPRRSEGDGERRHRNVSALPPPRLRKANGPMRAQEIPMSRKAEKAAWRRGVSVSIIAPNLAPQGSVGSRRELHLQTRTGTPPAKWENAASAAVDRRTLRRTTFPARPG